MLDIEVKYANQIWLQNYHLSQILISIYKSLYLRHLYTFFSSFLVCVFQFAAIQSRKTEKMPQLTSHKRARHPLQKQNVKTCTSRSQLQNSRGKRARVKQSHVHVIMTISGFQYVFYSQTCLYLSCMLNCSSMDHTVRLTATCFWTG